MNNLLIVVAVLATANTQITRALLSWLGSFFHVTFNALGNQITSWIIAVALAWVADMVGVIDVTFVGVLAYGLLSGLASNGIWNIKNWFNA
jgi:hypothetical protein